MKFGKDFGPTHVRPELRHKLRVCSWFKINKRKLCSSRADFWVFVQVGFKKLSQDFVIVPTDRFRQLMGSLHGLDKGSIHSYLWVTNNKQCWETRHMKGGRRDEYRVANSEELDNLDPHRNFTEFLNDAGWKSLLDRLG